jgi:hypothetical protein
VGAPKELFKPEIFKELLKPEAFKPGRWKPYDIDEMFDPILETLSKDQLKQLAANVQRRLG